MYNNQEIIMTQAEYDDMTEKLNALRRELTELTKSEAKIAEFHGYNSFSSGDIKTKQNAISYYLDVLSRAVIREVPTADNIIGLGDIVKVTIMAGNNRKGEVVKLVSHADSLYGETITVDEITSTIRNITVFSPLGRALLDRQVGETVSYEVNNTPFNCFIESKLNPNRETSMSR